MATMVVVYDGGASSLDGTDVTVAALKAGYQSFIRISRPYRRQTIATRQGMTCFLHHYHGMLRPTREMGALFLLLCLVRG